MSGAERAATMPMIAQTIIISTSVKPTLRVSGRGCRRMAARFDRKACATCTLLRNAPSLLGFARGTSGRDPLRRPHLVADRATACGPAVRDEAQAERGAESLRRLDQLERASELFGQTQRVREPEP